MERTKDGTTERLGLEFAEDLRLLQDIGWASTTSARRSIWTMPEHDLKELLQRLQGEAVNVLEGRRFPSMNHLVLTGTLLEKPHGARSPRGDVAWGLSLAAADRLTARHRLPGGMPACVAGQGTTVRQGTR
jgi:hypothetical protein